ncbi:MAG: hypothetical protein Alpg2KO_19850 [Alphaproteobacteria bacterium]
MSLDRMLGNMLSDALGGGIGGGIARSVTGSKKARKRAKKMMKKGMGGVGGSVVKYGGMAALGALAFKAYQEYSGVQQSGQQHAHHGGPQGHQGHNPTVPPQQSQHADFGAAAPPPRPSAPPPPPPVSTGALKSASPDAFADTALPAQDDLLPLPPPESAFNHVNEDQASQTAKAATMISAMIAAAAADGQIDADEKSRITEQVREADFDAETRKKLSAELTNPASIASLATACSGPEMAAEIYAASVLAIDVDHVAEQVHLRALAAALGLEQGLVTAIHGQLGVEV